MLASQWKRKGRDMSMTAPQSGKTSIGGAASSARRVQTVSSIAEVNSNAAPFSGGPLPGVCGEPC